MGVSGRVEQRRRFVIVFPQMQLQRMTILGGIGAVGTSEQERKMEMIVHYDENDHGSDNDNDNYNNNNNYNHNHNNRLTYIGRCSNET